MRAIIAGGRDYQLTAADFEWLDQFRERMGIAEVITGGASGADNGGDEWARTRGIPRYVFYADWKAHGRVAGPLRNRQMAEVAGPHAACVLFPGGRGTANMLTEAMRVGMKVFEPRADNGSHAKRG